MEQEKFVFLFYAKDLLHKFREKHIWKNYFLACDFL